MWKLLFMARRGWKLIPREQRRRVLRTAGSTARRHGPRVARVAGNAIKQRRKTP